MASDVDGTIAFWTACFGANVVADEAMAGARNVLLDVGGGRLNLYSTPPNHRGPVNHVGVQVDDLAATVSRLEQAGWSPRPIKTDGPLSYSMVEGPDRLLIEVFHFDHATTPPNLRSYFDLPELDQTAESSQKATIQQPGSQEGRGTGLLSPQALARLAGPATPPLRPPSIERPNEVREWRASIHAAWLKGDPTAEKCDHREETVGGVRCLISSEPTESLLPESARPVIVYLHGGGYCLGSPEVALPITERLSAHGDVVSIDYRLAPEHGFPAAIEDGLAVFDSLAAAVSSRALVLAGDSAGANLALSVALANPGRVKAMALFSPHLEFNARLPGQSSDPRSDVDETAADWLRSAYLGQRPASDPQAAPALGNLAALPPTLVQVGSVDSSLGDAQRFARRARLAGVDITLDVWDGLWHTWQYHRDLPEADRALGEAGSFLAGGRSKSPCSV